MVSLVVAMDKNGLIGKEGGMPWYCPEDLSHFKQLTLHHTILMGRITYEHIKTPLYDRCVHVATRSSTYPKDAIHLCHDVDALLNEFKNKKESLYVCGGASIYKQGLPYVDDIWISYIKGEYDGDTWFPPYTSRNLIEVMKKEYEDFLLVHYIVDKKKG